MFNPARKSGRKTQMISFYFFVNSWWKRWHFRQKFKPEKFLIFFPFLVCFRGSPASSNSHVVTNKNYYSHKMGFSNKRQRFRQLDTISLNMVNVKISANELPLFGQKCEEKFSKRGKNQSKHTMFLYRMEGGGDEESGRVWKIDCGR